VNKLSSKSKNIQRLILGWIFILPALFFIIYASVFPAISNFILSFQKWDGFLAKKWVWFENYIQFFKDGDVLRYLYNSVYLSFLSTLGAVLIGLFLAALVFKIGSKLGSFARLVFFIPGMIPVAINGLLFVFILNPQMGLLNNFLKLIGLSSYNNAWLEDSRTAMNCIVVVNIWMMCGITMVLSYAAIRMLPASLFESCKIDGGGYIRQLFSIVFPIIKNVIGTAAIYTLAANFKTYGIVQVMTQGGPGDITRTIPINMINTAFNFGEFGYAASMGVVLSLVVVVSILVTTKFFGGDIYEF